MIKRVLDAVESFLRSILKWGIEHLPMPSRLRNALRARRSVLEEMVKFAIAGLGATVAFFAVFIPLGVLSPLYWWQTLIIANVPAITVAYLISAKFVFANHNEYKRSTEISLFFVMSGIAIAIGASALGIVEVIVGEKLGTLAAILITAVATIASWGIRFVLSRRVIFKSHLDRPPVGIAEEIAHIAGELDQDESSGQIAQ